MAALKPSEELVAASFGVATVVSVFGSYTASVNDLKSDQPSHQNTSDAKRAAVTSTAIISGIALLAKSPTVFVVGGVTILLEYWQRAHANYTMPKGAQGS